ncbi:MAG: hypothetical protein ABW321_04945 [Polyangiales bacterium]
MTSRRPVLWLLAVSLFGCGGAFKQSVKTWASGPAYKGAVQRVAHDQALDDTSRRLELMSLSGLACTLDEDSGASQADKRSFACACSLPSTGADDHTRDCQTWAGSL